MLLYPQGHGHSMHHTAFSIMKWKGSWESKDSFHNTAAPGTFLFTLVNPHGVPPTKLPQLSPIEECSMHNNPSHGPVFGSGYDMFIADQCHLTTCYFNFPTSFSDPTKKGNTLFVGAARITVAEVEVYGMKNQCCCSTKSQSVAV